MPQEPSGPRVSACTRLGPRYVMALGERAGLTTQSERPALTGCAALRFVEIGAAAGVRVSEWWN